MDDNPQLRNYFADFFGGIPRRRCRGACLSLAEDQFRMQRKMLVLVFVLPIESAALT